MEEGGYFLECRAAAELKWAWASHKGKLGAGPIWRSAQESRMKSFLTGVVTLRPSPVPEGELIKLHFRVFS